MGKQKEAGEWIYFGAEGTTVRRLAEALEGQEYEMELWEDAGVWRLEWKKEWPLISRRHGYILKMR